MSSVEYPPVVFSAQRGKLLAAAAFTLVVAFAILRKERVDPIEAKFFLALAAVLVLSAAVVVLLAVRREPRLILDGEQFVFQSLISTSPFAWTECHDFYAGRMYGFLNVIAFSRDGFSEQQWIVNLFGVPTATIVEALKERSGKTQRAAGA